MPAPHSSKIFRGRCRNCVFDEGSNESPYDEPKGKEFSVIVLNADFEIIGETRFPGKKYFYKMSFVGKEGLYISENNLENPQFDENKLVFTRFKIKNASPNK